LGHGPGINRVTHRPLVRVTAGVILALLSACAPVGPDFVKPDAPAVTAWPDQYRAEFEFSPQDIAQWWEVLNDPVLNSLIALAHERNNNLKIAGLRVLEAQAILGIAVGNQYPQSQFALGDSTALQLSESNANTAGGGDLNYIQHNLGLSVAWEVDFWGRFRRGVEAADAGLLASIANYDDALVLLTAQVADAYTILRTAEEQLRIARENVIIQERSYEITDVIFRSGNGNELDMQRALTLLLSTRSSIPALEISERQAQNALSTLLGMLPGDLSALLGEEGEIPAVPGRILVGVPAEMLRQRPDVRRAELFAMSQNALVGVAKADLYPSFSISGSLGLAAAGNTSTTRTGDSGLGELFSVDSLTYAIGPSFVWPFFNYGRIENNIRVEDARLQQALIQYRETVIQAAREVDDAMMGFVGSQRQDVLLERTVQSALRSSELSLIRFREGFADYQRVIDAQQSQIAQQNRYVTNRGTAIRSLIAVYRALGGGWQSNVNTDFVDEDTRMQMEQRTNWGELLELDREDITGPGLY
jgi:NodT family efflux transporter outer membrane factor (OMF) lipoprotein